MRKIDGGRTIKERYLLSPEADQRFVSTKIEGSCMPQDLEFRWVYESGRGLIEWDPRTKWPAPFETRC